jgi:hypothetical protein
MAGMYSMSNVIFVGISPQEVMTNGALPEDYYQICIRAFNFDTDEPVSAETPSGCSAPFLITNLEPPMFTSPFCPDEIQAEIPQNVYINWTIPMGANPSMISYFFRMIEIPDNSGIDPVDALNDNNYASVYEEELNTNSLLLTSDKVQLVPGNTYAFFVQAISLDQLYYFNNDGVSEACWFTYIGDSEIIGDTIDTNFDISDFIDQFELIPSTKVSGRLFYKVPESGATPMSYTPPDQQTITENQQIPAGNQGYSYSEINTTAIGYTGNANYNQIGFVNTDDLSLVQGITGAPPFGRGTLHKSTESMERTNPLANTQVRLVVRLGVFDHGPGFPTFVVQPEGKVSGRGPVSGGFAAPQLTDIEGNVVPFYMLQYNIVLDVTETDENGNFSFDFRSKFITAPCQVNKISGHTDIYATGNPLEIAINDLTNPVINPVDFLFDGFVTPNLSGEQMQTMGLNYTSESSLGYICLKVEVVNQKFCSPDVDIFALPGDQIELGNQVAKLKTYNAAITVKSDGTTPQQNSPDKGIAGADIMVLRDVQNLDNEHPIVLKEEGQQLDTQTYNNYGEFDNVCIDETLEDGTLLLKNLVKYWTFTDNESPYLISIATRKENVDLAYDNTIFNYETKFDSFPTIPENNAHYYSNIPIVCNNAYQPPTLPFTYVLKPKLPEIKGRVMAQSNMENVGIPNAYIILFKQNEYETLDFLANYNYSDVNAFPWPNSSEFQIEREMLTNESGFFRFDSLPVYTDANNIIRGPYRRMMIIKEGYKTKIINPFGETPYNLNNGQLLDLVDINMEVNDSLKGTIVNEDGEPIKSYVRLLEDGPYYVTYRRQVPYSGPRPQDFDLPMEQTGNRIEIQPLSSQYFTREVEVNTLPNERQTFIVYKRLHRLHVTVINQLQEVIPDANIVVGDSLAYGKTNANGVFTANFASPDEQFVLKITAADHAPHQSVITIPASDHANPRFITLQPAFHIFGFISDAQTKEKIPLAKVYTELQNTDGHHLYLETETNNEGYYTLDGIPWDTRQLKLHIVKSGNSPSYIGRIAEIGVAPHNMEYYNFELFHIDGWDLTEILGFPMQAEDFTLQSNPDRAIIKGYIYNLPTTIGYRAQEANTKVPFTSLLVEKQDNGKIIPVSAYITLDEIKIPLKVNDIFTGMLSQERPACNFMLPYKKLKLWKLSESQGQIKGAVKLDLESFRFAYNFDGSFYVGDNTTAYSSTVFKSNMGNSIQLNRRHVFNINCQNEVVPVQGYSVFGFTADADLEHSIIEGNKISLKTILHTSIPMGENPVLDLKLPIGDIVIRQNQINIVKAAANEMNFMLEKWEVIAKKEWEFNINEEAIILPEVLINSQKGFSATVKNLRVRPDALREGEVSLQGGLNLGGIVPLVLANGLEPRFNYDAGIGHYRISLVGTTGGNAAAYVDGLPETSGKLEFESVGLLSNDENALTIDKQMRFFDIIDINVNSMMSGNGFFKLSGSPAQGFIPGFVPNDAIIAYTRPANKLKIRMDRLQGAVDCSDNVVFRLDQVNKDLDEENPDIQQLGTGEYAIYGDFIVSPSANEGQGDPFILRGFLKKTKNNIKINVIKVDNPYKPVRLGNSVQYLALGDKKLNVYEGNISVINTEWDTLRFKANPHPGDMKGLNENDVLNFKVNGNVSASADEISVSEIDTPFGSASFAFDFTDPSLTGALRMTTPISVGYVTLSDVMVKMRFDPQGFYILADGTIIIIPAAIPIRGGLVIGYTSRNLNSEVVPFLSEFKTDKPNLSGGLRGFYVIGQRGFDLGNFDIGGVVTANLNLGAGTYIYCNFADDFKFEVGGYGYLTAQGGITKPCDIGVFLDGHADIKGGYENGSAWFSNCSKVEGSISLCVGSESVLVHGLLSNKNKSWGFGSCPGK